MLPADYPHELPQIHLDCCRGKYPDLSRLKLELQEEAARCLGMAMVYSLSSLVEERVAEHLRALRSQDRQAAGKTPTELVNETRTFDGTPVTVERFLEWNGRFLKEMYSRKEAEEKKRLEQLGGKLTGTAARYGRPSWPCRSPAV